MELSRAIRVRQLVSKATECVRLPPGIGEDELFEQCKLFMVDAAHDISDAVRSAT